jgi:hypothetical protein
MKAFLVTEPEENTGGVIFAKHAIAARRQGASEYNDGQLGGMSCRRAEWADGFYETGVPARELIARGWWFECCGCGATINEDWLAEERLTVDGVIGNQHSRIFCHDICKTEHDRRETKRKYHQQQMIETMTARLLRCFPEAKITNSHAYARGHDGVYSVDQACIYFEFPGMKHGPATYRFDLGSYKPGPVKPDLMCARGDLEAFEAWAA